MYIDRQNDSGPKKRACVTWETTLQIANLWERHQRGRLYSEEQLLTDFWAIPAIKKVIADDPWLKSGVFKIENWNTEARNLITQLWNLIGCLTGHTVKSLTDDTGPVIPPIDAPNKIRFRPDNKGRLKKESRSLGISAIASALVDALEDVPLWKIGKCAGCLLFFPRKHRTTKTCSACTAQTAQKKYYERNKQERNKARILRRKLKKEYAVWIRDWKVKRQSDKQILNGLRSLLKRDGLKLEDATLIKWIQETPIKQGERDGKKRQ